MTISESEAKTHFSELLERISHGEVFTITRRGKSVATMGPCVVHENRPVYGKDKGRIHMAPDFDAPLEDMAEYEQSLTCSG